MIYVNRRVSTAPLEPSGPHGIQNLEGRLLDPSLFSLYPTCTPARFRRGAETALSAIQDNPNRAPGQQKVNEYSATFWSLSHPGKNFSFDLMGRPDLLVNCYLYYESYGPDPELPGLDPDWSPGTQCKPTARTGIKSEMNYFS